MASIDDTQNELAMINKVTFSPKNKGMPPKTSKHSQDISVKQFDTFLSKPLFAPTAKSRQTNKRMNSTDDTARV